MGIVSKVETTWLINTIGFAPDDKLVQVVTAPVQGNLEGVMKIGNRAVTANQEPSPDDRTDLPDPHPKLIDFNKLCWFSHVKPQPAQWPTANLFR
jgi:hypothetical protein